MKDFNIFLIVIIACLNITIEIEQSKNKKQLKSPKKKHDNVMIVNDMAEKAPDETYDDVHNAISISGSELETPSDVDNESLSMSTGHKHDSKGGTPSLTSPLSDTELVRMGTATVNGAEVRVEARALEPGLPPPKLEVKAETKQEPIAPMIFLKFSKPKASKPKLSNSKVPKIERHITPRPLMQKPIIEKTVIQKPTKDERSIIPKTKTTKPKIDKTRSKKFANHKPHKSKPQHPVTLSTETLSTESLSPESLSTESLSTESLNTETSRFRDYDD